MSRSCCLTQNVFFIAFQSFVKKLIKIKLFLLSGGAVPAGKKGKGGKGGVGSKKDASTPSTPAPPEKATPAKGKGNESFSRKSSL